jgi:hypothetical protein
MGIFQPLLEPSPGYHYNTQEATYHSCMVYQPLLEPVQVTTISNIQKATYHNRMVYQPLLEPVQLTTISTTVYRKLLTIAVWYTSLS